MSAPRMGFTDPNKRRPAPPPLRDMDEAAVRAELRTGPRPLTAAERDELAAESLNRLRLTPGALDIDYCTVGDTLDELVALRATVARLEREGAWHRAEYEKVRQHWRAAEARNEGLTAQVRELERLVERRTAGAFALEAERDAAQAALAGLSDDDAALGTVWPIEALRQSLDRLNDGAALEIDWQAVSDALDELIGLRRAVARARAATGADDGERPTIVCLCGSTRFWREFQRANLRETMAGRIVLSIGAATGTDDEHFGNLPPEAYARIKTMLDELHLRKVELADEVLILNCGGYVGESTARELAHARALGKRVRFLEGAPDAPGCPESGGKGTT